MYLQFFLDHYEDVWSPPQVFSCLAYDSPVDQYEQPKIYSISFTNSLYIKLVIAVLEKRGGRGGVQEPGQQAVSSWGGDLESVNRFIGLCICYDDNLKHLCLVSFSDLSIDDIL